MLFRNNAFDLFDDMFHDPFFTRSAQPAAPQIMKTDVEEKENGYVLDIELPGYAKEDVQAELKDGYLTIAAQKGLDKDEQDKKGRVLRQERYAGACSRSFYVGNVKPEDVKAKYEDGVLSVIVPKEDVKKLASSTAIAIE